MRGFSTLILVGALLAAGSARASSVELFAKGSASKNHISRDNYTVNVSIATGVGVTIVQGLRIEGRYTNNGSLQNRLDVNSGPASFILNDIKTSTTIYSLGFDLDLLGPKWMVQPFVYVGGGYVITERSYYVRPDEVTPAVFREEPKQTGISGNLGVGFRVRLAKSLAFEAELFAYGIDVHRPNPLVNLYGTIGIRIFL